jgi:hypothetical protein
MRGKKSNLLRQCLRFCQNTTEQETRRTKRDGLIDDEKQTNAHNDDLEMR